jgi:hypothetical protein
MGKDKLDGYASGQFEGGAWKRVESMNFEVIDALGTLIVLSTIIAAIAIIFAA